MKIRWLFGQLRRVWNWPWIMYGREISQINKTTQEINMKIGELADAVGAVGTQLAKAKEEIVAKIAALEAALTDVEIPPAAQEALDALKQQAQELDDVVPG